MPPVFDKMQMSDWIVIGTAGATIFFAALVAYHIAYRQGVFRKPRLATTFGPVDIVAPNLILLNFTKLIRTYNVAALYFVLKNNGPSPLSNVTAQFNILPKGLEEVEARLGRRMFDVRDVETSVFGDTDVLNVKYPSLAPGQTEIIPLPFVYRGRGLPNYGTKIGKISVQVTYDQSPKIEQNIDVVAISEPDFANRSNRNDPMPRVSEVTGRLARERMPLKVIIGRAMLNALFFVPFHRTSWIAVDVNLKPVADMVAMDKVLADRLRPEHFPATIDYGFNFAGRFQFLTGFLILILILAACGIYFFVRYRGWIS